MRTSAPGSCNGGACSRNVPRRKAGSPKLPAAERGFTLIELLVVLVIVGIVLGIVSVQLMPSEGSRLRKAGEQLALLLENAGMEARSSGIAMAWVGKRDSYLFFQRNAQGVWETIDSGSFRPRALEEGITIAAVELDGKPVKPGSRVPLSATSFAAPFSVKLAAGASVLYVEGDGVGTVSVTLDKDANAPIAQ